LSPGKRASPDLRENADLVEALFTPAFSSYVFRRSSDQDSVYKFTTFSFTTEPTTANNAIQTESG